MPEDPYPPKRDIREGARPAEAKEPFQSLATRRECLWKIDQLMLHGKTRGELEVQIGAARWEVMVDRFEVVPKTDRVLTIRVMPKEGGNNVLDSAFNLETGEALKVHFRDTDFEKLVEEEGEAKDDAERKDGPSPIDTFIATLCANCRRRCVQALN